MKNKNIQEILRSFNRTGKIDTSLPKSFKEARKQAVAIAFNEEERSKKGKR